MARAAIYYAICAGGCLNRLPAEMVPIVLAVLAVRKLLATCPIVLVVAKTYRQQRKIGDASINCFCNSTIWAWPSLVHVSSSLWGAIYASAMYSLLVVAQRSTKHDIDMHAGATSTCTTSTCTPAREAHQAAGELVLSRAVPEVGDQDPHEAGVPAGASGAGAGGMSTAAGDARARRRGHEAGGMATNGRRERELVRTEEDKLEVLVILVVGGGAADELKRRVVGSG